MKFEIIKAVNGWALVLPTSGLAGLSGQPPQRYVYNDFDALLKKIKELMVA